MKRFHVACLLAAFLGGAASWQFVSPSRPSQAFGQEATSPVAPPSARLVAPRAAAGRSAEEGMTPDEQVNVAVYEQVNRSVVNINTKSTRGDGFFMLEAPAEGAGSGSVIDQAGHILTNFHVVEDAREIQATLFDGHTYEARLVGADPSTDVAVIKIDAPKSSLVPVAFGDSSRLRVGQRVFAIGNPFGLERTLTTGIVSSLNRSIPARNQRMIKSIIQTDAAINPGSSGGPLLDAHSRLIGMNTAIASRTGQSAGVGFAIPVTTIARIVPELIQHGRVARPETGIGKVYQTEQGLLIATLAPNGPAAQAGLRGPRIKREQRRQGPIVYEYQTVDRSAADTIVAVDGKPALTADDFLSLIESKRPGATVVLSIIREGKPLDIELRLSAAE